MACFKCNAKQVLWCFNAPLGMLLLLLHRGVIPSKSFYVLLSKREREVDRLLYLYNRKTDASERNFYARIKTDLTQPASHVHTRK